jgi:hypothetical protein
VSSPNEPVYKVQAPAVEYTGTAAAVTPAGTNISGARRRVVGLWRVEGTVLFSVAFGL